MSSEIHQQILFVMLMSDVLWKQKSTKNFPVKEENSALRDELLESSENNLRCSGEASEKNGGRGWRWMEVGEWLRT